MTTSDISAKQKMKPVFFLTIASHLYATYSNIGVKKYTSQLVQSSVMLHLLTWLTDANILDEFVCLHLPTKCW